MQDSYLPQILIMGRIQPQELSHMFPAGLGGIPAWHIFLWILLGGPFFPASTWSVVHMLESPARAECPALEHHGLAPKASKFPSQRHEWSKAVAGTFTQGSTARQSKCCSTQPAGVCSLCPTQPHTTHARSEGCCSMPDPAEAIVCCRSCQHARM